MSSTEQQAGNQYPFMQQPAATVLVPATSFKAQSPNLHNMDNTKSDKDRNKNKESSSTSSTSAPTGPSLAGYGSLKGNLNSDLSSGSDTNTEGEKTDDENTRSPKGVSGKNANVDTDKSVSTARKSNGYGTDVTTTQMNKPPSVPKSMIGFYRCNHCKSSPLTDNRYVCQVCPDYDLCILCYFSHVESAGHLASHQMKRHAIEEPVWANQKQLAMHAKARKETDAALAILKEKQAASKAASRARLEEKLSERMPSPSKRSTNSNEAKNSNEANNSNEAKENHSRPPPHINTDSSISAKMKKKRAKRKSLPSLSNLQYQSRRRTKTSSTAGASMDRLIETVQQCELGTVKTSAVSTKAATEFCILFEAGKKSFKDQGIKFQYHSSEGALASINAMVLAGVALPKVKKQTVPEGNPDLEFTKKALIALLDQFIAADHESFFTNPVEKSNKRYYDVIRNPMDLRTLKELLEKNLLVSGNQGPGRLVEKFRNNLRQIWKNAMKFYADLHRCHRIAKWYNQATTLILAQIITHLNLSDHVAMESGKNPEFTQVQRTFSPRERRADTPETSHIELGDLDAMLPRRGRKRGRKSEADSDKISHIDIDDGNDSSYSNSQGVGVVEKPTKKMAYSGDMEMDLNDDEEDLQLQVNKLRTDLDAATRKLDALLTILQGGFASLSTKLHDV